MEIKDHRILLIIIFLISIVNLLFSCGDMPHNNPLDPENPNYEPPLSPAFTSIAPQNETVWFGSSGGGLTSFDGNKWNTYTKSNGLPDNYIEAVLAQGDNIWFTISGSYQKIFKFDGTKTKEYPTPPLVSLSANASHIWIGSANEMGTYDPGRDSINWYQLPAGGQINTLIWDGSGVWVAIEQPADKTKRLEISRFDVETRNWRSSGFFPLVNDETLLAFALDGDILWGGTSRGDIRQFGLIERAASRTQVGISPPGVWKTSGCIAADESSVWFGYGGRGLIRYDKISSIRESFFAGEAVYGIAVTDLYVWSVTSTGAYRYEKRSGVWTQYKYPEFDMIQ